MRTIKGPGIFLAQFVRDDAPFNSLAGLAQWASGLGYKAVQIPTWDTRLFNLRKAAESSAYCDDIRGQLASYQLEISELSTHLQGQLIATHPAYDAMFAAFGPASLTAQQERQQWATEQLLLAARAARNLKLAAHATFSGALAWPYFYPWPQQPKGLIDRAFSALADRWSPILDAFDRAGVDLCFELHPGEDLHDGATFERFRSAVNNHPRACILFDPSHFVLQQLDYLAFVDLYHPWIRAFHVKDAEFHPNGRSGVYGGYQNWIDRPGRFRSLGDGQIDFARIFSKLAQYDYPGWAVLEWEDCLKTAEDGAREGAHFISQQIIHVTEHAFDDFSGASSDPASISSLLGLSS